MRALKREQLMRAKKKSDIYIVYIAKRKGKEKTNIYICTSSCTSYRIYACIYIYACM